MIKISGKRILQLSCLLVFGGLTLTGCASTQSQSTNYTTAEIEDPLEDVNRVMFDIHNGIDQVILEPTARGYRAVTPKLVRNSVQNFLRNLRSPVNIANQMLQGDVDGAATDLTRAVVNTSFGIGGLFDVAGATGLEYEKEDFGQTLAVWGVGHGPYLVIPVMGPSSFRDATGSLVDAYLDPLNLYLANTDQEEWIYIRGGATAISQREELLDVLEDLRENSFDYYAALRSTYVQRRQALVNDDDPDAANTPEIPSYDDY